MQTRTKRLLKRRQQNKKQQDEGKFLRPAFYRAQKTAGRKSGGLACRKSPSAFSASSLQSAARIICLPKADKFHTCGLRSIFCQVHALTENVSDFIFCFRRKLCEAFLTVCKMHPLTRVHFYIMFMLHKLPCRPAWSCSSPVWKPVPRGRACSARGHRHPR